MTTDYARHRDRYIETGDPAALKHMAAAVTDSVPNQTRYELDRLTPKPPALVERGKTGEQFDEMLKEAARWFLVWPWAPLPADFDGSRFAWWLRTVPQGLIVFAIIYGCLGLAGVVHG